MKRILFILIANFSLSYSLFSQDLEWAFQLGSPTYDYLNEVKIDKAGNLYTFGYFNGTMDFDPGPGTSFLTSTGGFDAFILKTDPNGNFIWAKQMGGQGDIVISAAVFDNQNNLYITGSFSDTVDINPGSGINTFFTSGFDDIFIERLDTSGNMIWGQVLGDGCGDDSGNKITFDSDGNVIVSGSFKGPVDFEFGSGVSMLTSLGNTNDGFILKLKPSGDFIWVRQIGSSTNSEGCGEMRTDKFRNIFMHMYFEGTIDFDPGAGTCNLTSNGGSDFAIVKLDSSGIFQWAFNIGSSSDDQSTLNMDSTGNIYLAGYFEYTVDFDPGPGIQSLTSNGFEDIFILKLDSARNFIWVRQIGNYFSDRIWRSTIDKYGNIYFGGSFRGTMDFDPGPAVYSVTAVGWTNDFFAEKLDKDGNFIWLSHFVNGGNFSGGKFLAVDENNNTYLATMFIDSVDYDPGPGTSFYHTFGNTDIFVVKINYTVGMPEYKSKDLLAYPNPATNSLFITAPLKSQIEIYNLEGQCIKRIFAQDDLTTLDVSGFSKGMYIVKVSTEKAVMTGKFVKQ